LGQGDVDDRGDNSGEMGDALEAVEVVGETSLCEVIAVCEWCADQVARLMEERVGRVWKVGAWWWRRG